MTMPGIIPREESLSRVRKMIEQRVRQRFSAALERADKRERLKLEKEIQREIAAEISRLGLENLIIEPFVIH